MSNHTQRFFSHLQRIGLQPEFELYISIYTQTYFATDAPIKDMNYKTKEQMAEKIHIKIHAQLLGTKCSDTHIILITLQCHRSTPELRLSSQNK